MLSNKEQTVSAVTPTVIVEPQKEIASRAVKKRWKIGRIRIIPTTLGGPNTSPDLVMSSASVPEVRKNVKRSCQVIIYG